MAERQVALVTGVTGQDGSYLAELLLDKGYEVHGIVRRASTFGTERVDHLYLDPHETGARFFLHYGDLADANGLSRLLAQVQPTEVYNLGAQSHVAVSFEQPLYTADVTGLGTLRLLEAIRQLDEPPRYYQASSSEMFGKVAEVPQRETTPFHPRSPYGVAKVYGFWQTVNYREAYGLHASNGILFNHECVPAGTPVAIRRGGFVDIVDIADVVPHRTDPRSGRRYASEGGELEVWDGEQWAQVTARTATWHDEEIVTLHGRGGVVSATEDHVVFCDDGRAELPAGQVEPGARLWLGQQPTAAFGTVLTPEEAWFLGLMCADGYISEKGKGRLVNGDESILAEAGAVWSRVAAGQSRKWDGAPSGFGEGGRTAALELTGNAAYLRLLRGELYTRAAHKRVPVRILNAAPELQVAFLTGYNLGDGLKAGNGTDLFKSFRTTSPVLAAGLVWLVRTALGRRVSVYAQEGALGGGRSWLLNLSSGGSHGDKGSHLRKPQEEVRRVDRHPYEGWMFDLATTTGRFAAGVGFPVVHNSPRRGETFVTRKVTRAATRIKLGLQDALYLGNLDAERDWGFAGDFVEAMWRMLQADAGDDYVVATGERHSVRQLCEAAFSHLDLDWQDYVEIDKRYLRPSEVDILHGDASKARAQLGWEPTVRFAELVEMMVAADLELARQERTLVDAGHKIVEWRTGRPSN
jgi:GDPmannose 4,6-dehydratase